MVHVRYVVYMPWTHLIRADSIIVLLNEVLLNFTTEAWSNAILWLLDDMCAKTDFLSSAALI